MFETKHWMDWLHKVGDDAADGLRSGETPDDPALCLRPSLLIRALDLRCHFRDVTVGTHPTTHGKLLPTPVKLRRPRHLRQASDLLWAEHLLRSPTMLVPPPPTPKGRVDKDGRGPVRGLGPPPGLAYAAVTDRVRAGTRRGVPHADAVPFLGPARLAGDLFRR